MSNIKEYILKNNNNMSVKITNYGAIVMSVNFKDKNGKIDDIILGYDSSCEYKETKNEAYFGAIVGPYANRIAKGKFILNEKEYTLDVNNEPNHLHGGFLGLDKVIWDAQQKDNTLKLQYLSKDMSIAYPGNVLIKVIYTLNNENELKISYEASSDKDTILNLTNHMYFNLEGQNSNSIDEHELFINSNKITKIDETLIPTGEILDIRKTELDFTNLKIVGSEINHTNIKNEQLLLAGGYDHNYILIKDKDNDFSLAASLYDKKSKRYMEVFTTQPGIQFYSGNFLEGIKGKNNKVYKKRNALCLETQHYPDSPNHEHFPSTILKANEKFKSVTIYKFSLK